VMFEAEGLIDGFAEARGVQGDDDVRVFGAALGDSGSEECFGVAFAAVFRFGKEVEQIGAVGLGIEIVRRPIHVVNPCAGDDLVAGCVLQQEADVTPVGEALGDPGKEVGIHLGVPFFAGKLVVSEHAVAMVGDEGCVVYGGSAKGEHGG